MDGRKNDGSSYSSYNSFVYNEGQWDLITIPGYLQVVKNTYFAFTTLCTVGFGDLYPVSVTERGAYVLIFLFGVALFSYFMGDL
jgi:hypothetical protein